MKKILSLIFALLFTLNNAVYSDVQEKFTIDQKPGLILSTKQIVIPDYPNAFNPSIIKMNEGYLLTFRVVSKKVHISHIGFVFLNEDLELISEPEIVSPRLIEDIIPSQAEDARIFSLNGNIYLMYNDNDSVEKPERRDIYLAKVNYENGHFTITSPLKLYNPDYYKSVKVQKNWVPFEWDNKLLVAYSINPHEIIYPDLDSGVCFLLDNTKFPIKWRFGTLRGGTPAMLLDDEYLAFFHSSIVTASEATDHLPMRHYFMGAYTFQSQPPFTITQMTNQPLMHPSFYTKSDKKIRVVFPGGYAVSGNNIYLAYGKDDHEVWIATIDIKKLKEALKPVPNAQQK